MKSLIVPFARRIMTRTFLLSALMVALPMAMFGQTGSPRIPQL